MCTVLLDYSLEVKAFAQPLGVEGAWNEIGDGFAEIEGNLIRVRPANRPVSVTPADCDGDEAAADALHQAMSAINADEPLLEDTIEGDTQLVGRDSCIVWNSVSQELSFCIMFNSERGCDACTAAMRHVVRSQRPPPPPLTSSSSAENGAVETPPPADDTNADAPFTHDLFAGLLDASSSRAAFAEVLAEELAHIAKLGFIERHAAVMSLINGGYVGLPGVIGNTELCHALLALHHPSMLEHLLEDHLFPTFVAATSADPQPTTDKQKRPPSGGDSDGSATLLSATARQVVTEWSVPTALQGLPHVADVNRAMTRVWRLHQLAPSKGPAEANPTVQLLETVVQRNLGELLMQLMASDTFFEALGQGLSRAAASTTLSIAADVTATVAPAEALEQHLRCLADVLETAAKVHTRDGAIPAVGHVFDQGSIRDGVGSAAGALQLRYHAGADAALCRVLDASVVLFNHKGEEALMAQCFRDPLLTAAAQQPPPPPPAAGGAVRGGAAKRSAPVAKPMPRQGLQQLLAYLVHRTVLVATPDSAGGHASSTVAPSTEPSAMGGVESTTLATPLDGTARPEQGGGPPEHHSYGFKSLGVPLPSVSVSARGGSFPTPITAHGAHYLFHWLGLHDDEGTTVDRAPTAEAVTSRTDFQRHFIDNHVYTMLKRCQTAATLPEGVANLLEYLLRLTPPVNRDRLVHMLLSSKSPAMKLIAELRGGNTKAEVCASVRLVRALLTALYGLESTEATALLQRLTFAQDVFGAFLQRTAAGSRGMVQCVLHSLLATLYPAVPPGAAGNPSTLEPEDVLEPLRRFVVLRHRGMLPSVFVARFEAAQLLQLQRVLHVDFKSPVPFSSPSRAISPALSALDLSGGGAPRRSRVAEEPLPPDQRHSDRSNKLRALVGRGPASSSGSTSSMSPTTSNPTSPSAGGGSRPPSHLSPPSALRGRSNGANTSLSSSSSSVLLTGEQRDQQPQPSRSGPALRGLSEESSGSEGGEVHEAARSRPASSGLLPSSATAPPAATAAGAPAATGSPRSGTGGLSIRGGGLAGSSSATVGPGTTAGTAPSNTGGGNSSGTTASRSGRSTVVVAAGSGRSASSGTSLSAPSSAVSSPSNAAAAGAYTSTELRPRKPSTPSAGRKPSRRVSSVKPRQPVAGSG